MSKPTGKLAFAYQSIAYLEQQNQQLKQRIEQLERERNEYRDKWIRKCKELDIVDEQLAQRDIEQQEKGVNHVGAVLTGMGFCGVESLCKRAIEQLHKGVE